MFAVADVLQLQQRLEGGCELIHNTLQFFEHMVQTLMRCIMCFVDTQGQHIVNFL
jgi:hypothetical protein